MDDYSLAKRREFTITCDGGKGVEITDGTAKKKKGGNLRAHVDKDVTWTNATELATCYLEFKKLPSDADADDDSRIWPFKESAPPGMLLELPLGAPQKVTLALEPGKDKEPRYVEYLVLGADKTSPLLDPIIIIDPN